MYLIVFQVPQGESRGHHVGHSVSVISRPDPQHDAKISRQRDAAVGRQQDKAVGRQKDEAVGRQRDAEVGH